VIELKQLVLGYLEGKKDALKTANEEASRSAVEGAVLLGVMVTLALLSLGFLSRSLQRDVLGRLLEVGHVTEAIARATAAAASATSIRTSSGWWPASSTRRSTASTSSSRRCRAACSSSGAGSSGC
jgi:hypothetical protein